MGSQNYLGVIPVGTGMIFTNQFQNKNTKQYKK